MVAQSWWFLSFNDFGERGCAVLSEVGSEHGAYNRVAEAEEQSFTAYGHADDGHGVVKADGGRGEEEWWLKVGGFCLLTTLLLK